MRSINASSFSFGSAVPRDLVHRRSISEVFITDIHENGQDSFAAAAQWPRWHVYYGAPASSYDSSIIAETLRQATILISHSKLEVPLGQRFLLPDMAIAKTGCGPATSSVPAEIIVTADVHEISRGRHGVKNLRILTEFWAGEVRIARGEAGARIMDEESYARLRRSSMSTNSEVVLLEGLEHSLVGHSSPWNVVLGKPIEARTWPLRVDTTNPIYFDHPLDHVPGALLIEAARQAIRAATGNRTLDVESFTAIFSRIVELNEPTSVNLSDFSKGPDGAIFATVEFANDSKQVLARIEAEFKHRSDTGAPRDGELNWSKRPNLATTR